MKDIMGQLAINLMFYMEDDVFDELVKGSGFSVRKPPSEAEFMTRFRELRPKPESIPDTVELTPDGMTIHVYATPENLAAFLRKLPVTGEGGSWSTQGILAYKFRIDALVIDGSALQSKRSAPPGRHTADIGAILGRKLIDAGLDLYGAELDSKDWFHLSALPATNRADKTSVRLVVAKTKLDDMADFLLKVPQIIKAVEKHVLGS